jgi:RHS repeat-associated protein
VSSWLYDAASRVTANLLANGTQASYTYDNANRILLLANLTSGGTTLSSFNYTYNPIGNRTQVVEADGDVVSWTYDPTYQLTNEQRSGANSYNISYTYDPVGNRTLMLKTGAPSTSTYNTANEMATIQSSAGVTTNTYDGDGNLLISLAPGNQWTTNTWDGENRLTQVALPSGVVDTFMYNGDGQRVQKQDSTGATNYVWNRRNILLETNVEDVVQTVYTLEPEVFGNVISQTRSGVDSFYLFDALGSTRQLASTSGAVTDNYLYDSFGNILLSGTTITPFKFVGRKGYYTDLDSGNCSLRARYYAASIARFQSRDPIGLRSGTNLYIYVLNNPATIIDPSGLQGDTGFPPPPPIGWIGTARAAACSATSAPLVWRAGSPTAAREGYAYSFAYVLKGSGCCQSLDDAANEVLGCSQDLNLPSGNLPPCPNALHIFVYNNIWNGKECDPQADKEFRDLYQKNGAMGGFRTWVEPNQMDEPLAGCVVVNRGTIDLGTEKGTSPKECSYVTWEFACPIYCIPGPGNVLSGCCNPGDCSVRSGSGYSKAKGLPETLVVNWQGSFGNIQRCSRSPCQVGTTVQQRFH